MRTAVLRVMTQYWMETAKNSFSVLVQSILGDVPKHIRMCALIVLCVVLKTTTKL